MTYAVVVLFTKKEGLSLKEFKHLIETSWVPTMERVCGPLFPCTYSRRYIAQEGNDEQRKEGPLGLPSLMVGKHEDVGWDCLIECTFEDDLHLAQFFSLINEEQPAEELLACESTFSDTNKLRIIMMEGFVSVNKSRKLKTWE